MSSTDPLDTTAGVSSISERDATTRIDRDATTHIGGDQTTMVTGSSTLEASEVVLRVDSRLVIEFGNHRLLLDESGLTLELDGAAPLTLSTSAGEIRCDGESVGLQALRLRLEGSTTVSIDGGAMVSVTGAMIKLN